MTKLKIMPHSIGAYLKGVGVESVELDANNHLIVHLDNGETVDAGEFKVDDELDAESTRPLANKTLSSLFSAVNERINTLVGGNATEAIDNLNEIIDFLQNFKDSETLASTLAEINNAITEGLSKKVDKENGKGLSSNDYTDEEKNKLNSKQDALTLTVKDNGNIVIGNIEGQTKEFMPATPSGDPMHYKYLKVHGLTYDESTGLWAYRASEGGLTDLTTDEVANMYIVGGTPGVQDDAWCRWAGRISTAYPARTNICPFMYGVTQGLTSTVNFNFAFTNNSNLIVAVVTERSTLECVPKECSGMFRYSQNLVRVIGKIDLTSVTNTGQSNLHMFGYCNALEEVDIINLKVSIHFGESPLLSKRSLLYMIQNAKPTSAITITLHAEAYARLANDADIVAALAAQPNISLIKS